MGCVLALVGCGADSIGPADGGQVSGATPSVTDPWLSGDISDGAASTQSIGVETGSYDSEDFFEDDEPEAFYYGEADIDLGSSYDGWGGLFILSVNEQGQEETLCEVTWSMEGTESVSGCDGCDFAFRVTTSSVEVTTNVTAACDSTGFVAAEYEGRSQVLAYRSGLLLYQDGDGYWFDAGEASYQATEGFFEYYFPAED